MHLTQEVNHAISKLLKGVPTLVYLATLFGIVD